MRHIAVLALVVGTTPAMAQDTISADIRLRVETPAGVDPDDAQSVTNAISSDAVSSVEVVDCETSAMRSDRGPLVARRRTPTGVVRRAVR